MQASTGLPDADVLELAGTQIKSTLAEAAANYTDPLQGVFSKIGRAFSGGNQ